ncbi:hypothetical protein NPIL_637211 [Nephila pilipes]|uniref:Uncharacterized protein n=1 Tax=Nephila pilipes TaxID=299642 RepID=A0A8X6MS68_NEPPI|nr:hypothetical protein NPIL_637211 [Nephila pilipes]
MNPIGASEHPNRCTDRPQDHLAGNWPQLEMNPCFDSSTCSTESPTDGRTAPIGILTTRPTVRRCGCHRDNKDDQPVHKKAMTRGFARRSLF